MADSKSLTLYYRNGSSDKVYHARIEPKDGGYIVNVAYGRSGSTLTTGTKTPSPIDLPAAITMFDKLITAKKAKGYTEGENGQPYEHTDKAGQVSGLHPQLLNTIDDTAVAEVINDQNWLMQEKFDGRRLMLRKASNAVEGINKLGLVIAVSTAIGADALALPGDFVIDGEAVGDWFHAFDILSLDGADLREQPYTDRFRTLSDLVGATQTGRITPVACWRESGDKADQLAALRVANAEGVVFKRVDAPYRSGRPASGGTQLKLKFVATVSALVVKVNTQRSVAVSLLDEGQWRPVGNVTVPANQNPPAVGDVIEVRYLYANPGGALFQPVYLGLRDDIEPTECVAAQLKFKSPVPAGVSP